jgi:DNA-binding PadR family transcriptional regulator
MSVNIEDLRGLSPRSKTPVVLLDDPPVGHLQAIILKKLDELGRDAFGYNVLEQLSLESGVWMDHSQIYSTIRKLLGKQPDAFIEHVETRPSQDGGPPFKVYKLTAAGRAALKATAAHHTAVAEFLTKKNKR